MQICCTNVVLILIRCFSLQQVSSINRVLRNLVPSKDQTNTSNSTSNSSPNSPPSSNSPNTTAANLITNTSNLNNNSNNNNNNNNSSPDPSHVTVVGGGIGSVATPGNEALVGASRGGMDGGVGLADGISGGDNTTDAESIGIHQAVGHHEEIYDKLRLPHGTATAHWSPRHTW